MLKVLSPGLCSLLVDHGRPHTRRFGVPVGGAADRSALAIGNAVLDNPPDAAALEITLVGPVLLAWFAWYLCRGPRRPGPTDAEIAELQVLTDIERHEDLF